MTFGRTVFENVLLLSCDKQTKDLKGLFKIFEKIFEDLRSLKIKHLSQSL